MKFNVSLMLGVLLLGGCGTTAQLATPVTPGLVAAARHKATLAPAAPMPDRYAEVVNTHHDLIFRGGVPNDAQLAILFESGVPSAQAPGAPLKIKTIVNLLDPASKDGPGIQHESAVAKAHGVTFINIALPWGQPNPTADVQTWFNAVTRARAAKTALYIHCTHGRDRTGSMVAAYRQQFDGWTPQKSLDEMEGAPFNYDPKPYPWITTFVLGFKPLPAF